jgi:hypothetical protein
MVPCPPPTYTKAVIILPRGCLLWSHSCYFWSLSCHYGFFAPKIDVRMCVRVREKERAAGAMCLQSIEGALGLGLDLGMTAWVRI